MARLPLPRLHRTSFVLAEEVATGMAAGRPVVALESAVIGMGLPPPLNVEVARSMEETVRANGAIPATICVADGRIRIGCSADLIERIGTPGAAVKTSTRALPIRLHDGRLGATTVAATLWLAHHANIEVFATGGIGGVHPGQMLDISADLTELGRTPGNVVCAGPKTIVDAVATAEYLESLGVLTIGIGTDCLPWFVVREAPVPAAHRVEAIEDIAAIARWRDRLGVATSLLICQPVSPDLAIDRAEFAAWEDQALVEARGRGIAGAALTPFLLDRIAVLSGGRTVAANRSLLIANAAAAARLAVALAAIPTDV